MRNHLNKSKGNVRQNLEEEELSETRQLFLVFGEGLKNLGENGREINGCWIDNREEDQMDTH